MTTAALAVSPCEDAKHLWTPAMQRPCVWRECSARTNRRTFIWYSIGIQLVFGSEVQLTEQGCSCRR